MRSNRVILLSHAAHKFIGNNYLHSKSLQTEQSSSDISPITDNQAILQYGLTQQITTVS